MAQPTTVANDVSGRNSITIGAFALAGLFAAALQPLGFSIGESELSGAGGIIGIVLGNPGTSFSLCLLLAGAVLWRKKHLTLVSTTRRVSWAAALTLFSFPVGVLVSTLVFLALDPPMNSDGPPIEPTFLQRYLGDYAIPIAIVFGGFVVLAICWHSVRVLCGVKPKRYWLVATAVIFGTLIATLVFNYWYVRLVPGMERDLRLLTDPDLSNGRLLTSLFFVELAGTITMLFIGQMAVGAAIGYWLTRGERKQQEVAAVAG